MINPDARLFASDSPMRLTLPLPFTAPFLPTHLWWLVCAYSLASLVHFVHNAEYIAFYPNMPSWIGRETVYWAWLAIVAVGVAGLFASRLHFRTVGALLLAGYGALGLDGLAHYTLALCSEHTLATTVTIWAEVVSGFLLLLAAGGWCGRLVLRRWS